MAGVAARVDAGDLAPRMRLEGRATEIDVLATSFDHMLDRLEEAFARQAAFVADASHELRTPLTVVRGQLEVLALDERPSRDEVRRVERLVRTEVERMSRLVDDLLVLAQAGEVQFLHRSPVPLPGFLGDLVAGLRKGQRRAIVLDDVPPLVVDADSDRLAQALRNLVANAVAHAGPGGTVRVSVERSAGAVRLLVDDDGPGIAPDQRERVFDRFQRLDTGRARAEGGAGLGLAIVRAVAQAHGGRAWAEDSPLGGARFVVELPT
jgi:signal transduction histidine kinase